MFFLTVSFYDTGCLNMHAFATQIHFSEIRNTGVNHLWDFNMCVTEVLPNTDISFKNSIVLNSIQRDLIHHSTNVWWLMSIDCF